VAVVLAASLVAAVTDLWKYKVYNALTLPLLASGLLYHGWVGGLAGLLESMLGVAFGFGVLFSMYLLGGIGAGDVKLLAAIGAWLGMPLTFVVFLVGALLAGLYALVLIVTWGSVRETAANLRVLWYRLVALGKYLGADDRIETELGQRGRRHRVIPFATMLAIGLVGLLVWAWVETAP
jgi:prepilin peptidase CpaA